MLQKYASFTPIQDTDQKELRAIYLKTLRSPVWPIFPCVCRSLLSYIWITDKSFYRI